MVFISGIAISVFLFLLLLVRKSKSPADRILFIWFLFMSVHQALFYVGMPGGPEPPAFLLGLNMPLPLIHGPFLFLYVSFLVGRPPKHVYSMAVHFLPALACYAYMIPFLTLPAEQKQYIMANEGAGYEVFISIKDAAIILTGVVYVPASLVRIRAHQRNIENMFSDTEKINLRWLQYLTYGIGMIWLVVILGTDVQTFVAVAIFVMTIGFFGIRQTAIFTGQPAAVNPAGQKVQAPVRESQKMYENSGLSEEKKRSLAAALQRIMEEEKIFLDPEVSLDSMASKLDLHPNYLSQYINEVLGLTFYDYINSRRIDEFKRLIRAPKSDRFNFLGLALECGFNSKSSFNRNFKRFVGKTPTAYLNT